MQSVRPSLSVALHPFLLSKNKQTRGGLTPSRLLVSSGGLYDASLLRLVLSFSLDAASDAGLGGPGEVGIDG